MKIASSQTRWLAQESTRTVLRRASTAAAVLAVLAAAIGVPIMGPQPDSGTNPVLAIARADCPPDCGGGPGNGGTPTGPPGGGTEFVPPSIPAMPSYDPGRGQPPLDQNNGISIYNSAAPQPSQAAQPSQASVQNQDGSYSRAANGEQQPIQHGPEQNQEVSKEFSLKQQQLSQNPDNQLNNPQQAAQELSDSEQNPTQAAQKANQPEQPQGDQQNTKCTSPNDAHLVVDDTREFGNTYPDFPRSFNNGLTQPAGPYEALTGDPVGDNVDAPMRLSVSLGNSIDQTDIGTGPYGKAVAEPPSPWDKETEARVITNSTIPNTNGLFIGEVATGPDIDHIYPHGRKVFQETAAGPAKMVSQLPDDLAAVTAYAENGMVALIGTRGNGNGAREMWQVPASELQKATFDLYSYASRAFNDPGKGQGTLTKTMFNGEEFWVLYETTNDQQGARTTMTTRMARTLDELVTTNRHPIQFKNGNPISSGYHGADQVPLNNDGLLSVLTSRGGADDGYGISELRGAFQCLASS